VINFSKRRLEKCRPENDLHGLLENFKTTVAARRCW